MAQSVLQILLTAKDMTAGALASAASGTKTLGQRVNELSQSYMHTKAAVIDAFSTIDKIMEFGKQGAQLIYMEDKFNSLAASIGTTGYALKTELSEAMQGLMSDAELVKASGDLMALGLAKTSEEVVRMTRVAGQMGMDMNQLVLTLTNQTTMRFDALGVSVDGFDERLEALKAQGYSTNEAFTEAFLQQAEEQLALIGDVADSDMAAFMRLDAATKNLSDSLKLQFAPALADSANAMTLLLGASEDITQAFKDHRWEIAGTLDTYEAYQKELIRTTALQMAWVAISKGIILGPSEMFKLLTLTIKELTEESYESNRAGVLWQKSQENLTETTRELRQGMEGLSGAVSRNTEGMLTYKERLKDVRDEIDAGVASYKEQNAEILKDIELREKQAAQVAEQSKQMTLNASLSGVLTASMENYLSISREAVTENEKLVQQYWELANSGIPETSDELLKLNNQINANNEAQYKSLEAMRESTAQMIYQQAAQGLNADAALELARSMGLVSEEDYTVAKGIQDLRAAFDSNRDGMIDAAEGAEQYTSAIKRLHAAVADYQNQVMGGGGDLGALRYQLANVATSYQPASFTQAVAGRGLTLNSVINYQPIISTADQYQLENALRPVFQKLYREMR